jgi:hypothetical protein
MMETPHIEWCFQFENGRTLTKLNMFMLSTLRLARLLQPHFGQVWGWNSHPQGWGFGVLWDSQIFRVWRKGAKHLALGCSWCHWKGLEVWMSEMASHWSFGHLQPKLWAKERPGVKLIVWLPTIKSQESTRCRRVLGECDMALESSRRGLQVWFRPRHDRRLGREAMMS